jgi:hypothetical protein
MSKQILIVLGILLVFGCADVSKENQLQTGCSESSESTPANEYVSPAPSTPDTKAPTISSASPSSEATSISVSSDITITFSESMDSSTINTSNITLKLMGTVGISGTVSYNNNVATFNPSSDLNHNHTYTVTVGTGVKDSAGNALGSSSSWRFTTVDLPTAISNGTNLTCALLSNKTIKCWGHTGGGQTGDTDDTSRMTPTTISGISAATAVSGGGQNSCALLSDETIKCWGLNGGRGQLGNGSMTNSYTPVTVSGISNAIAVTGGRAHTCALLSNNTVQCWGYNYYGQLGDGSTILRDQQRTTPITVSGISNATAISAGDYHNCALLSSNTVQCWGSNGAGQLGNGTSGYSSSRSTPVTVQF